MYKYIFQIFQLKSSRNECRHLSFPVGCLISPLSLVFQRSLLNSLRKDLPCLFLIITHLVPAPTTAFQVVWATSVLTNICVSTPSEHRCTVSPSFYSLHNLCPIHISRVDKTILQEGFLSNLGDRNRTEVIFLLFFAQFPVCIIWYWLYSSFLAFTFGPDAVRHMFSVALS